MHDDEIGSEYEGFRTIHFGLVSIGTPTRREIVAAGTHGPGSKWYSVAGRITAGASTPVQIGILQTES